MNYQTSQERKRTITIENIDTDAMPPLGVGVIANREAGTMSSTRTIQDNLVVRVRRPTVTDVLENNPATWVVNVGPSIPRLNQRNPSLGIGCMEWPQTALGNYVPSGSSSDLIGKAYIGQPYGLRSGQWYLAPSAWGLSLLGLDQSVVADSLRGDSLIGGLLLGLPTHPAMELFTLGCDTPQTIQPSSYATLQVALGAGSLSTGDGKQVFLPTPGLYMTHFHASIEATGVTGDDDNVVLSVALQKGAIINGVTDEDVELISGYSTGSNIAMVLSGSRKALVDSDTGYDGYWLDNPNVTPKVTRENIAFSGPVSYVASTTASGDVSSSYGREAWLRVVNTSTRPIVMYGGYLTMMLMQRLRVPSYIG